MDPVTYGSLSKKMADPAKIATAVSDWLDDHPEATTTVEDGSITKAKLDSNLQGTVDDVSDLKNAIDDNLYIDAVKSGSKVVVTDEDVTEVKIKLTPTQEIPSPYLLQGFENEFPVSTLVSMGNDHSTENVIVLSPTSAMQQIKLMDDYEFEEKTSYRFSMWALRVGDSGSRIRVYYTDGTYEDMYSTKNAWSLVNATTNSSKTVDYFNVRYSSYTADSLQIVKNSVFLGKASESEVTTPVGEQTYSIDNYPTTFISNVEMTVNSKQSIKDYVLALGHGSNLIPTVAEMRTSALEDGTVIETSGYSAPGDGGGAKYIVSILSGETDDGCTTIVCGDMVAKLLPVNGRVNAQAFGIGRYDSGSLSGIDDTDKLDIAITYSSTNKVVIVFNPGYYYFTEVNLIGKNGCMLEGVSNNLSVDKQATHFVSVGTATNDSNSFICTNELGAESGSTFTATSRITLKNLILHESASRNYGLYFAYTTSSTVSNIVTIGFVNGIDISTTWYSIINRLQAKSYTGIGISIYNTTNALNLYDLYSESDQSANAAFRIYGSHSVLMTNVTIEGNSDVAFILREYPSNRNGFVLNNLHCENVKCLIALETASNYSAFEGMSSGRIEINGGCWTPLLDEDTCIIKQVDDEFYRLRYLTLRNLFVDTRVPSEPISSTLDISLVDNFEEKIDWRSIGTDGATVLTECTIARIHGVTKSRYGVSECAGTGFDRIYSGRPDKYTVLFTATSALDNATVIAPLIEYSGGTLKDHHIEADVKYYSSNTYYNDKYSIDVLSDGTITSTKTGSGPVNVTFSYADGALKAVESASSMQFTLDVENLGYYIS